jgi:hypothetical protein
MNTRTNALCSQFSIRPSILGFCIFALGTLFMAPVFGSGTATDHSVRMISDDINDTATPGSIGERPADTTDVNGQVEGDNGHGNNEDGVDSSNPGQGPGGPGGQVDESCDGTGECVDDESGNGNGNGHGRGNGNGRDNGTNRGH